MQRNHVFRIEWGLLKSKRRLLAGGWAVQYLQPKLETAAM